jgi:hypothetical protein
MNANTPLRVTGVHTETRKGFPGLPDWTATIVDVVVLP